MATSVKFDLPDELVEALDREIASGSYTSRDELVRQAIERLLDRIEPAAEWSGRVGLELLRDAAERLPYKSDGASPR